MLVRISVLRWRLRKHHVPHRVLFVDNTDDIVEATYDQGTARNLLTSR